mmetsp:Transcript_45690/g.106052  ORF Transcript_45690/g.106052 Transcript_45690/m.106052 type:complete len:142 (-) Transcript_45690:113-538(-)
MQLASRRGVLLRLPTHLQLTRPRTVITDVSSEARYGDLIKENMEWPTLVFYTAPWCVPCREVGPRLQDISRRFSNRLRVLRVDVDEVPALASSCKVESVPYFMFLRDNRVVERMTGANFDEVSAATERHVNIAQEELEKKK